MAILAKELAQLLNAKATGSNQWQSKCPAHEDKHASLSIGSGDNGQLLAYCHAGCDFGSILDAAGISGSAHTAPLAVSVGVSGGSVSAGVQMASGRSAASTTPFNIVETYDYEDADGVLQYQVCRMEPKDFRPRRPDGKGGWVWNMKGVTRVLYKLPDITFAKDLDQPLFICEGEKDADSLVDIGLYATTAPFGSGKNKWLKSFTNTFENALVYILPDNDESGVMHAERIAEELYGTADKIKIVRLPNVPAKGDVTDWLTAGGNRDALIRLAESAAEYCPMTTPDMAETPECAVDYSNMFVAQAPGIKFYRKAVYIYRKTRYEERSKEWLEAQISSWLQRHTQLKGMLSTANIRSIVSAMRGHPNCQLPYHGVVPFWADERSESHTLVFENGMLELADDGEFVFTDGHDPRYFNTVWLPYDYDPHAKCPKWERFVEQVLEDEIEDNFLQEWFGYSLDYRLNMQKMLILLGEGSNGKSVTLYILRHLLGIDNVSSVPLNDFGSSFKLYGTFNKFANIVNEIGELDKTASGNLKLYVGGDPVVFERKYHDPFTAQPTAKLIFATNNLPHFSDRSYGMWRRMQVLPFRHTVKKEDQNHNIWAELKAELPGILNWALDGLRRLRDRGNFIQPISTTEAVEAYKRQCSPAESYLHEAVKFVPEEHQSEEFKCYITDSELWLGYQGYLEANGHRGGLNRKNFGVEIGRKYGIEKVRKRTETGRMYVWPGIVWEQDWKANDNLNEGDFEW